MALYWAPDPDDPLAAAGNAWLGRDAELRIDLTPGVSLSIALTGDPALSAADLRALRAAAAPLVAELARRGLTAQTQETP